MNKRISPVINILFEDNHLIVVEKPNNIPTQRDKSNDLDMLTILKDDLKDRYNKKGNVYLGLIHRLDRPVGGVMVFAKTSKAASRLSEQVRMRFFRKVYLAIVQGQMENKIGTLKHLLIKNSETNIVSTVSEFTIGAKEAILNYEVIRSENGMSLIKIELLTGRSHQIRVQFSDIGYPLIGDQKYGNRNNNIKNIALWSHEIIFNHPVTKEVIRIISNPPDIYPWNFI